MQTMGLIMTPLER